MHEYEVRILKRDRGPSLVFRSSQRDDGQAVHMAKKLAAGRALEVWRDLDCICRVQAEQPKMVTDHAA